MIDVARQAMAPAQRLSQRLRRAFVRSSGLCLLLSGLSIASIWLLLVLTLSIKHEDALAASLQHNLNVTHLLEEQTQRLLGAVDLAHHQLGSLATQGSLKPADYERLANQTGLANSILAQLSFISNEGLFVGSNIDPDGSRTGPIDLSDRDHVRTHLQRRSAAATSDEPTLYISAPVLGKVSRRWTLQTSRAVFNRKGELEGITVASLDPSYFEAVYRGMSLGRHGSVSLLNQNLGKLVQVIGGARAGSGQIEYSLGPINAAGLASSGRIRSVSPADGIERLIAYRRIANYPLYVVVSSSVDEVLGSWRSQRNGLIATVTLLTLVLMMASLWLYTRLRQQEQAHDRATAHHAHQQSEQASHHVLITGVLEKSRQPLAHLRGFVEKIQAHSELPILREQAAETRRDVEALNVMLLQALDLSKANSGALALNHELVSLEPLLKHMATLFSEMVSAKALSCSVTIAPELPTQIHCDPMRLRQILRILVNNACTYSSQGAISLRAALVSGCLDISVTDSGPGMAPEQVAQLFTHRWPDGGMQHQPTAGIGFAGLNLALAHALAHHMGGDLTVTSALGQGSCFTLRLPLESVDG